MYIIFLISYIKLEIMPYYDGSTTIGQLTAHPSLYNQVSRFDDIYKAELTNRVNPSKFMFKPPDGTDINLEGLRINGRLGQQDFKGNVLKSRPLNLFYNGRDLAIFRNTNLKPVDISGTVRINEDMHNHPISVSAKKQVYGIIGV